MNLRPFPVRALVLAWASLFLVSTAAASAESFPGSPWQDPSAGPKTLLPAASAADSEAWTDGGDAEKAYLKPESAEQVDDKLLKRLGRKLTAAEYQQALEGWVRTMQSATQEVVDQEIAGESEALTTASRRLERLQAQFGVMLKEYVRKGGTPEEIEAYEAFSSSLIPATTLTDADDVAGLWQKAQDWITDPDQGLGMLIDLGIGIVVFLGILWVFRILSRIVGRIVERSLGTLKSSSKLLRTFLVNTARKVVFFIGVVVALGQVGVDIGPFLAAIGAAGFVIGFALQGTLSNFANGVMIMIYRPYDVGDVVNMAGIIGSVHDMTLVSTTVRTFDNQSIVVPNSKIWGDVITNITANETRRVDLTFGIGYSDDIQEALDVLTEIVSSHPKVLKDPEPVVKMHELADSSVNFIARPWCNGSDYWDVYWDVTRQVKERFDALGISIPFPQRDVHVYQQPAPVPSSAPRSNAIGTSSTPTTGQDGADADED